MAYVPNFFSNLNLDLSFIPKFYQSASTPIKIDGIKSGQIDDMKNVRMSIISNSNESVFYKSVMSLNTCYEITYGNIKITYLGTEDDMMLACILLHVTNTIRLHFDVNKPLNIFAFFTNEERKMTSIYPTEISGATFWESDYVKNINMRSEGLVIGGLTRLNDDVFEIYLSKKQGIVNLLIHELFHYMMWNADPQAKNFNWNGKVINKFQNIKTINTFSKHLAHETYCEANAILYMSAYYAFLQTKNITDMTNKYKEIIMNELNYSYFLAIKFLRYLGPLLEGAYGTEKEKRVLFTIFVVEYVINKCGFLKNLIQNVDDVNLELNIDELKNLATPEMLEMTDNTNDIPYSNHQLTTKNNSWQITTTF